MGGADVAVARDTTALSTNPAGLVQLQESALDVFASPYYGEVRHVDGLGNHKSVSNPAGAIVGFGYAQPLQASDVTVGIGLFGTGGSGFIYDNLETGFGNRDQASALFGVFKLTPGVGWRVSERLTLGANLGVAYAQGRQTLFPETSYYNSANPQASFFGTRLEHLVGFGLSGKAGLQYRLGESTVLGLAYTGKSPLDLKGGRLTVNYDDAGLGKVVYRDARLGGLGLGQQIEAGLAFRPYSTWLIAIEGTWIDWSSAMRSVTLEARQPDNSSAPATIRYTSPLDWRDQYVLSIGTAYQWDDKTTLRAGYNHGRTPVRAQTLTPLLALIQEDHLCLGFGRKLGAEWELGLGLEMQLHNSMAYDNSTLPISHDAKDSLEVVFVHLMLSRRW